MRTFSWEELEQGLVPDVDAIVHLAGKAHDTKNKSVAAADRVDGVLTEDVVPSPVGYLVFMKRYYHLHEEYLESLHTKIATAEASQ